MTKAIMRCLKKHNWMQQSFGEGADEYEIFKVWLVSLGEDGKEKPAYHT